FRGLCRSSAYWPRSSTALTTASFAAGAPVVGGSSSSTTRSARTVAPSSRFPSARSPRRPRCAVAPQAVAARLADFMRAVDALMECLKAEGAEVVFGLPGGANLPTYDAFYDAGIRHILVRHEAGGGHAAEGYAKATGRVGVSLGTSGPGATNLVTPICDAMMDSVPVVFLT